MHEYKYIGHKKEDGGVQSLLQHLEGTAKLAYLFAEEFNEGEFASSIALWHDVGKYSVAFQKRIIGSNISVDHSTPGGQLVYHSCKYKKNSMIATYCIMGHHSGIPNGGAPSDTQDSSTLLGRLKKNVDDISEYENELPKLSLPIANAQLRSGFGFSFLIRMLFSSLVDADYLDTESFVNNGEIRKTTNDVQYLRDKFFRKCVDGFIKAKSEANNLDFLRTSLLEDCILASSKDSGLFKLTAPTGSGKTISSMAFALNHAIKYGKKRIIYIVPYNTIIEQNARVFEDILDSENILQHHSNIQYEDLDESDTRKILATENWDYPIVFTSNVQFFESFFSNRTSDCRKLHNVANSVLVFDEAQMIPISYLIPCISVIKELVTNYRCTALLTTATQSSLETFFAPLEVHEIATDVKKLYHQFKRSTIQWVPDPLELEELVDIISDHKQILCIVNSRKAAQAVFKRLYTNKVDDIFHLSTLMYPLHRSKVLKEIRKCLEKEAPCRVISTSLVEAGVDLDFPAVYREEAGIDSIIQAAGRCNREGKKSCEESIVNVFTLKENKIPSSIKINIDTMHQIKRRFSDMNSIEIIIAYFEQLFYNVGDKSLDKKQIIPLLNNSLGTFLFPFKDISDDFHIIEENTKTVYIFKKEETQNLEERLRNGERTRNLFKKISPYGVSLYTKHLKLLIDSGYIERIDEEVMLLAGDYYNEYYGIPIELEIGNAIYV